MQESLNHFVFHYLRALLKEDALDTKSSHAVDPHRFWNLSINLDSLQKRNFFFFHCSTFLHSNCTMKACFVKPWLSVWSQRANRGHTTVLNSIHAFMSQHKSHLTKGWGRRLKICCVFEPGCKICQFVSLSLVWIIHNVFATTMAWWKPMHYMRKA